MRSSSFQAKQFQVEQGQCAMKVSTDSILLGCLAQIEQADSVLDIGTGTGILSLMCAQRQSEIDITAVELDPLAAVQARANCQNSPWSERIHVLHEDIRNLNTKQFDAIVCNPPYYENDLRASSRRRNQAKHDTGLTLLELLTHTQRLLAPEGLASFIFPFDRSEELMIKAGQHGLHPVKRTRVHYQADKPAARLVVTLGTAVSEITESRIVVQHSDNSYTQEYVELSKAFLTKLGSD